MTPITFFCSGDPKGQPRPRAFAMKFGKGKDGKDKYQARVYNSDTAEGWKGCVASAAKEFLPAVPLDIPVRLTLVFYMPRPKSHFNSKSKLKESSPVWFGGKPDADNLAKAVMDALTLLGMWRDDSLVVKLTSVKAYSNERPGCDVIIEDMNIEHVEQKHWNSSVVANLL